MEMLSFMVMMRLRSDTTVERTYKDTEPSGKEYNRLVDYVEII